MIKHILFDADGVTIDSEVFSIQYSKDFGVATDNLLPFFNGVFGECMVGKADLKEIIVPYLKDWRWDKSVDELLEYWFKAEDKVNEKVISAISNFKIKGIKCYLATNQEKYRIQYMKDKMNFSKIFDKVYASSSLGVRKPSLEFYRKVIEDLGITNKKEVLFWDDSEKNVIAAKEFGINAELYKSFNDFQDKMKIYGLSI